MRKLKVFVLTILLAMGMFTPVPQKVVQPKGTPPRIETMV
jgi:hypothetical protein